VTSLVTDKEQGCSITGKVTMQRQALWAAGLAAGVLVSSISAHARGEWPDGPNKQWLESLERPDNAQNPYRKLDPKSLSCCGAGDTVKTKFKVEYTDGQYPEDVWYAWLNDSWVRIPPEKIVKDFSPTGEPYLFLLAGTIQCFVPPKGGL
jgi:hypothetical protein